MRSWLTVADLYSSVTPLKELCECRRAAQALKLLPRARPNVCWVGGELQLLRSVLHRFLPLTDALIVLRSVSEKNES
jgi:hypothetical protein